MNITHEITICLGSSCFSRGNKKILEVIKAYLKEHNLSGQVFFHGDLCSGHCEQGPVIKINDQIFKMVNADNIYDILNASFN
jgi:NADH:ubiquinone oxidoreductase subunit E